MRTPLSLILAAVVGFSALAVSQSGGGSVRLTVHEGTSMAAAVSPDGRTIAIDLLGALWTLSIDGGNATRILEHYVRGGLSPAEALRTATIVPADAMGLGADLGTIERGRLADLVVVDGNPLANISDIRRTRRVVKDGVVYDVDALLRRPARPSSPSQARLRDARPLASAR